jgi:hypothetical protein
MGMNADNIKTSLRIVHDSERSARNPDGMPRPRAVEHAIKTGPKLSHAEVDVLLRAVHVRREELSVWQDCRADRIAELACVVGDDGSGDLGVIVDSASPDATTDELVEIVRETRRDAALER